MKRGDGYEIGGSVSAVVYIESDDFPNFPFVEITGSSAESVGGFGLWELAQPVE